MEVYSFKSVIFPHKIILLLYCFNICIIFNLETKCYNSLFYPKMGTARGKIGSLLWWECMLFTHPARGEQVIYPVLCLSAVATEDLGQVTVSPTTCLGINVAWGPSCNHQRHCQGEVQSGHYCPQWMADLTFSQHPWPWASLHLAPVHPVSWR